MELWKAGLLAVLLSFSAGCGQVNNADDEENNDEQAKAPTENVFSGQVKTIDRAKGVEQTLMKSAQEQNAQIEQQSQ